MKIFQMASVWSEHPGPFLSTSHTKVENEREWIPGFLSRTRRGLIGTEITGQIRDTNHGSAQNCRLGYSDFYRRVVSILPRLPFQIRSSSSEDDRRGILKQCGENYKNGISLKILEMIYFVFSCRWINIYFSVCHFKNIRLLLLLLYICL